MCGALKDVGTGRISLSRAREKHLTGRQRRFLELKISEPSLSSAKAARLAGYSESVACLPATFAKRCPTVCEELAGARSSLRSGRTFSHIADGSKRMPRDFFDPTPEQQNVVLVEAASLRKAEQTIVPQMLPLTFSQDLPTLTICRFRLCMVGPCYVDFRKLIKC